jgi:hypothetical protein
MIFISFCISRHRVKTITIYILSIKPCQVSTALVARREALLKQLGNAGFDKQLELTDQRLRLCDVTKEATALKARVQAALALGSDQRCVTTYIEVMTSLSALDATVVPKADNAAALVVSPLEAVTVSASLTARVDVSALMVAVGQWGHVEV